ncbi:porin family protein [Adhaeribacter terreus]|uniref:Porin family protein n=1 Tax=Adhaeribacter terreus TaxID=529703 RepID=A0ABW0E8H1_9BACT
MHKKLFFAAAFAAGLFFSDAKAQSISVGPRVGINFSHVAFTEGDAGHRNAFKSDQEDLTGAHVGIVANLGLTEMLSIQPEILYSQKGHRHEGIYRPWNTPYEYKYSLNYLEIPVLLKATFGSENLHAFVNGGPYLGYLLGGKNNYLIGGNESETELELKYRNGVKPNRSDVGLAFGGGFGSKIGPGNLALELRYGLGLSDLNQYQQERDPRWPKYSNRTLGVSVSYLVPIQ